MSKRAWIAVLVVIVLAVVYRIWLWPPPPPPPPPEPPAPQVAALACNEAELIQTAIRVANGTKTKVDAGMRWDDLMHCLKGMEVDEALGEKHHTLLPVTPDTASASIFPRRNVWWDDPPDPAGRVMARIESNGKYLRMGLDPTSQNYVIVFGLPAKTPTMIVVNAEGAIPIGKPEGGPAFIPHGPIVGSPYRQGIDPPPLRPADSAPALSPAALKCFLSGLKACFIDSATEQTEGQPGGFAGFGIGMPVVPRNPGMTVPWVACVRYGCCCGGNQCHT